MVGPFPGGEKSRDVSIVAPAIVLPPTEKVRKCSREPLENPLGFRKKNPTFLTVGVVNRKELELWEHRTWIVP